MTGPKGGTIAAGLRFAFCKTIQGVESVETGTPNQRQPSPSPQNRNKFDSTPQIPIDNNDPYYQEPDPLDDELDTWRTEEEFVTVDDVEHDFTTDFDVHPS